jgi:hypothetical protein
VLVIALSLWLWLVMAVALAGAMLVTRLVRGVFGPDARGRGWLSRRRGR